MMKNTAVWFIFFIVLCKTYKPWKVRYISLLMYRMNTFARIILNQNPRFIDDSIKHGDLTSLLKYSLIMQLTNPWYAQQPGWKFRSIQTILVKNPFISIKARNDVLEFFSSAQRFYHSLRLFACIVKRKQCKKFECDMDLLMNPLNETRPSHRITIYENSTAYEFKLGDLETLANKRLSHSPSFFADPQPLTNPYTNLPFSLPNLYRIYFKIRETCLSFPILLHRLFLCGFDLDTFMATSEVEIREFAIKDFCRNASEKQKHRKLSAMLYLNRRLAGHDSRILSSKNTIDKVKHLLPHYLTYRYSLNPTLKFRAERYIANELHYLTLDGPAIENPFENLVPEIRRRVRRRLQADFHTSSSEEGFNDRNSPQLVVESIEHAERENDPIDEDDPEEEEIIAFDDNPDSEVSESEYDSDL